MSNLEEIGVTYCVTVLCVLLSTLVCPVWHGTEELRVRPRASKSVHAYIRTLCVRIDAWGLAPGDIHTGHRG